MASVKMINGLLLPVLACSSTWLSVNFIDLNPVTAFKCEQLISSQTPNCWKSKKCTQHYCI